MKRELWNDKNVTEEDINRITNIKRGTEESFLSHRRFIFWLLKIRLFFFFSRNWYVKTKFLCLLYSTHLPWPFFLLYSHITVTSVCSALDIILFGKRNKTNKKCLWLFLASSYFLLISSSNKQLSHASTHKLFHCISIFFHDEIRYTSNAL